jgi:hypothetical protein
MQDLPDSDILPLSLKHTFWTWSAQAKVNRSRSSAPRECTSGMWTVNATWTSTRW